MSISSEQYKAINSYVRAKNEGDIELANSLKSKIFQSPITIDHKTAQNLLEHSINQQYKIIRAQIGETAWNKMNTAQQVGVMDHCFHFGNINTIKNYLKQGDYQKASEQMRKDTAYEPAFHARY